MSRWPILLCVTGIGCVAFRPVIPLDRPETQESHKAFHDDPPDHLALAADALDRGDDRTASLRLSAHLFDHPEDATTRAQLAELLFQQARWMEARAEYTHLVAQIQHSNGPVRKRLLQAHTRLMQIAQEENDAAMVQLHRGIGLFLLVQSWDADHGPSDETLANATLLKAVRALKSAREKYPARANLYMAMCYERLGEVTGVRNAYRCAIAAMPFELTSWERDELARRIEQ